MDSTNIMDMLAIQVVQNGDFGGNNAFDIVAPYNPATLLYNPIDDALVNLDLINSTIAHGYNAGLYFVMPHTGDGKAIADAWSAKIEELGTLRKIKLIMIDNEKVSLQTQNDFIMRWDFIRYGRPTIYCVEPFQGPSDNNWPLMLARNAVQRVRKIAVQTYFGGMQPIAMRKVIDAVAVQGINYDDLMVCTDPAQDSKYLSQAMTTSTKGGILFQAGRIPR